MRVRRLELQHAPGLTTGLPPLELEGGLTLLVGPNASGKSTLARSIRALAWPELDREVRVAATCEVDGTEREVFLNGGRADWSPALQGAFPDAAKHMTGFGLRSLLNGGEGDQTLAQELFQELAGGLDLDQAAKAFASPAQLTRGHGQAKRLSKAQQALQVATSKARDSSAEEQRLVDFDREIALAQAASQRSASGERLRELVEAAATLRALEQEGATFAAGLGDMPEDIKEQIQRFAEELRSAQHDLDAAAAKAKRIEAQLAEVPVRVEDLDGLRLEIRDRAKRLQELVRQERELADARTSLAEAQASLTGAEARLRPDAGEQGAPEPLSESLLEALATAVAGVREATSREADLRQRLKELDRRLDGDAEGVALKDVTQDDLVGSIRDLREWLRSPDGEVREGAPAPRALAAALIAAGALALVAAIALDQPWLSAGLVLGGVGLGLLRPAAAGATGASGASRDSRRAALRGSPLAPERWDEPTVQARLSELEEQRVVRGRLEKDRSDREAVREDLGQAEQEREGAESARASAAEAAGVSLEFADLGALLQAQRLRACIEAASEVAGLERKCAHLSEEVARELSDHRGWIEARLPGGAERPVEDAAAAETSLEALGDLCDEVRELERSREQAGEEQEGARARVTKATAALAAAWASAGVEPDEHGALDLRLDERGRWLRHEQERKAALTRLGLARERYGNGEALRDLRGEEAEQCSPDEIDGWLREDQEAAARLNGLNEERGSILGKLDVIRDGAEMEDALAEVRAAEQEIQDARALAAEDLCARLLLGDARPSLDDAAVPAVLEKARDRFKRFTHGGWQIDLDPAGGFRARDVAQDRERSLEELSDGTRAQLLLAARLASLECSEGSLGPLPLCLDEALSTTDPGRFSAIADVLFDEVDGGRQVIYLTADPGEVQQWLAICKAAGRSEPQVVDLSKGGSDGADWSHALPSEPAERDPLPDPDGHDAGSYARAIGVPAPDGAQAVTGWHLWLVLRHDLAALRQCLQRRVSSIGVWESVRGDGLIEAAIDPETCAGVDDLIELTHALARAWQLGRGRPVTWKDVEESGGVSDNFEDAARELLLEHERAPAAFLEAVRALPRFRAKSAEKLEAHLFDVGCLSHEAPLGRDALVVRSLAACPEAAERLGEAAAAHVEWVIELLSAAEPGAAASERPAGNPGEQAGAGEAGSP